MLTPEQIEAIRIQAGRISDPITEYLLKDISRRIKEAGQLTSTAAYQVWAAQNLGLSQRQIKEWLRKQLKLSRKEIKKLLTQAAETGYNFDIARLPQVQSIPFHLNPVMQQITQAAVTLAEADFTNIVQTLGMVDPYGRPMPLREAYHSITDFAFKQVFTGAADYNTAIRQASNNLVKYGVQTIAYGSGKRTSLEAAIRRNIMGGLGLMQEQISQYNHDALGADGWEITAHHASAPDHEPIQGLQYSDADYKKLNDSLKRRIGTLNCGHAAFPIIMGVNEPQYTDAQLKEMADENKKGVIVDGKHYTGYQATDKQRQIERAIRAQKRRVMLTAGKDQEEAAAYLKRLQLEYKRFSNAAGLRTEDERLFVAR